MPSLWRDTIEAHRREVREAILDTTAALAAQHGPLDVTMSQIAEQTGIARATLYKYFAGVEEILRAWHERQVSQHLDVLAELAAGEGSPLQRLTAVLEACADIQRDRRDHTAQPHGGELAALLHRDHELVPAERQLRELLGGLLAGAATQGEVRSDVPPEELVGYCLHALSAAAGLESKAAGRRLVGLVLDALHAAG